MNTQLFNIDEVAENAMKIFWQKGYSATSIQDLVDKTGLSRSSLYNTFDSKHGIFLHALRRYHKQTAANVALLAEDGSARERIRFLLQNIVNQETGDEPYFGCLITNTSLELGGQDEIVSELLGEHFSALETALIAVIKRGQQQNEIGHDKSSMALAQFIVAMIQGLRVIGRGYVDQKRTERMTQIINTAMTAI